MEGPELMSYPNSLSNNLAISLINLTKSSNLGLRSDTKILGQGYPMRM